MVNGSGWINTMKEYEDIRRILALTPGVFFFSSESNADAANAFEQKWTNLQRSTPGAMFFRVDVDQFPEIAADAEITSTPMFLAGVGDDANWEEMGRTDGASNGDWVHFKSEIAKGVERHMTKDTWNPEDHEGNVTKKETRRTGRHETSVHDHQTKIDADRIVDDGLYDGFGFEKDGEGEFDYSLKKTA